MQSYKIYFFENFNKNHITVVHLLVLLLPLLLVILRVFFSNLRNGVSYTAWRVTFVYELKNDATRPRRKRTSRENENSTTQKGQWFDTKSRRENARNRFWSAKSIRRKCLSKKKTNSILLNLNISEQRIIRRRDYVISWETRFGETNRKVRVLFAFLSIISFAFLIEIFILRVLPPRKPEPFSSGFVYLVFKAVL